jgi:hypothetical protein
VSWDIVYLAFLMVVMGGLSAREAWLDRTPRKPWSWAPPDLVWWAEKYTRRERFRVVDVLLRVGKR